MAITNNKRTAKEIARLHGNTSVIELLQQYEDGPDVKEPDCN